MYNNNYLGDYMKKSNKIAAVVLTMIVVLGLFLGLTACKKESTVPEVVSIYAESSDKLTYTVGTAWSSSVITVYAVFNDDSESAVSTTAAIFYDVSVLKLDANGKYTEAGTFTLPIRFSDFSTTLTVTVSAE